MKSIEDMNEYKEYEAFLYEAAEYNQALINETPIAVDDPSYILYCQQFFVNDEEN